MSQNSAGIDPVEVLNGVERRERERAKAKPPEERDLMETLLAADVPLKRAATLIADETSQAVRGTLAQYSFVIRRSRMPQFPEGSEVHRRLGMIADMLDPRIQNADWDYGRGAGR